jgi:hypothetical protein
MACLRVPVCALALGAVALAAGCQLMPPTAPAPAAAGVGQPVFVPSGNQDFVWERTVDVLHEYPFEIVRENRLDGVMETRYKVGSGILEPWHHESVGLANRVESTLQSIRRKVVVRVVPAQGGFLITPEAYKELEDVIGITATSPGGATFQDHSPLQRDLNLVVGQSAPSGWILLGRDVALEQDIRARLQAAFAQ